MANNSKPKPSKVEKEIKTYNPTKSKAGRIILLILAIGMVLGIVVAAIYNVVNIFT
ncbi:MAG: hypothetical protein ACOX16_02430 [Candidatus Izemoplasmatales bacterium]|jgi:flagellar basal body-associated protein FliL|nr:hypothetical protein [Acholeplasmataceae bacterium]